MGSSTIILKEYYIYVSNLIAIYSKGFSWIFFNRFFCWFYPYVLFIDDGWSAGSSDITFKGNPLRMIQAKLGLNWPSGFRGEDFWKSLQMDDRHQSDGNSSYRWAKNCSVARSWQAEHVFSLNLTSISYSFWNKGRKVLRFWWKKDNNSKMGHGINIYLL